MELSGRFKYANIFNLLEEQFFIRSLQDFPSFNFRATSLVYALINILNNFYLKRVYGFPIVPYYLYPSQKIASRTLNFSVSDNNLFFVPVIYIKYSKGKQRKRKCTINIIPCLLRIIKGVHIIFSNQDSTGLYIIQNSIFFLATRMLFNAIN